ncbi:MAG TPA: hypothetical protein VNI77_00340, partial [Nitrososphaera sp.]|nr:hypothetical protein [Nitrososphaera sp.]
SSSCRGGEGTGRSHNIYTHTETALDGTTRLAAGGSGYANMYMVQNWKKEKSLMERFIQQVKDRTECFDDHFACRKRNCSRQHVLDWLKLFLLYLDMGADRMRFTLFLARDGG